MPNIDIEQPHHMGRAQARATVQDIALAMHAKLGVTHDWQGDVLHFAGTGVNGTIAVTDQDVRVTARLGLLLGPLKGRIEQDMRQRLAEHFA